MEIRDNPFYLKGYNGTHLFCDREAEISTLIENAENNINTTLYSIRRMGKTGLLHHLFKTLEKDKNVECIYLDIYATQTLNDFTNQLASAIFNAFLQNKSLGKKFLEFIKNFNPVVSYDALTGVPEISLSYSEIVQKEYSLKSLFAFLDGQNKPILIALDEFQQVAYYPEKNTEALLRTIIQGLKKTIFIFSGSEKHLLLEMFNSAKRPFFSSTNGMYLGAIPDKKYSKFIKRIFTNRKRKIDKTSIEFILDWTKTHTYYTQAVCNKIYARGATEINIEEVYKSCDILLREQENIFFQYRKLLTPAQWKLLKAIAKEDKVYKATGSGFIRKYNLGSSAAVLRSLKALDKKEMIVHISEIESGFYQVYDCFLSRWLARQR